MLKINDLRKIWHFLHENHYDEFIDEITIKLGSQELLNKLNEEFFYSDEGNKDSKCENVDEFSVNIGFIKYIFKKDAKNFSLDEDNS